LKVGRQRGSEEISRIGLGELLGVVVLQICEKMKDNAPPDGFRAAIASNCSLREGSGLKAKRACRLRMM
jgi:hypothetical protein